MQQTVYTVNGSRRIKNRQKAMSLFLKIALIMGCVPVAIGAELRMTTYVLSAKYSSPSPFKIIEPIAAGIGDIDEDGQHEILILRDGSTFINGKIYLLDYQGKGTYDTVTVADSIPISGHEDALIPLLIEDFNGDQKKDFTVGNYMFINLGSHKFAKSRLDDSAGYGKCAFDADKDGDLDILCYFEGYFRLSLLKNDGKGVFTYSKIDYPLTMWANQIPILLDWDNDNDTDVFCYDRSGTYAFTVYLNNGNGVFTRQDIMAARSVWGYRPVDYDLDGDYDIALVDSQYSTDLRLYEQSGAFFNLIKPFFQILSDQKMFWFAVDMDHDGIEDIYPSSGECWVKNTGTHSLQPKHLSFGIFPYGMDSHHSIPFDCDSDGDIDFLGYAKGFGSPGYLALYLSNLAPDSIEPSAGKTLVAGTVDTITWESAYEGKLRIKYTTDAGKTWLVLNDSVENSGSLSWDVPQLLSDSCKITISDTRTGTLRDTSDGYFSIVRCKLFITAPKTGDTLVIGDSGKIAWTTIGKAGSVDIIYAMAADSSVWHPIAAGIENTGIYLWQVDSIPASTVILKVRSVSQPIIQSDGVRITILPAPSITIVSPNGGEKLQASFPIEITWRSTQSVSKVRAFVSVDSGNTWELLADSVLNSGRLIKYGSFPYSYTYCFAKLTYLKNEACFDISDSSFSIQAASVLQNDSKRKFQSLSAIYRENARQLIINLGERSPTLISISVCSLLGKRIFSIPAHIYPAGTKTITVEDVILLPGIYFLKMEDGTKASVRRFAIGK